MNWDAIVAITEVVGIIGLIASLIYVAIQIRQNSAIARANIVHGTSETWVNYHLQIASNAELADILVRGRNGETLSTTETFQFEEIIEAYIVMLEDLDHQFNIDLYFDEEDETHIIEYMAPAFKPILYSPIGRNWWLNIAPHSTTPSLFKRITSIMAKWDQEQN